MWLITVINFILVTLLATHGISAKADARTSIFNLQSDKNFSAKNLGIGSRDVTSEDILRSPSGDWLTYNGDYRAHHRSYLNQITDKNVENLNLAWSYKIADEGNNLRSLPIVYDGIIYVTASNEVHALDAKTGQWLWKWQAHDKKSNSANRGIAIYKDKVFFLTSDCYLVALNRKTGDLMWYSQYADPKLGYYSTMAPLVVKDTVITGISNNNAGSKGFVVALSAEDGRELWKFWVLPKDSHLRGSPTWVTGSYDPDQDLIYWPIGVLAKDQDKELFLYDENQLYNDSIVVLDLKSGQLKKSVRMFGNRPFDWDSNEPIVVADIKIDDTKRNVMMQANRNGMFYLMDRNSGKFIFTKPFVSKINWTNKNTCPSSWGGTNWMSPSFDPARNIFYVMALEGCAGEGTSFHIKALELTSNEIIWDYPMNGTKFMAAGILTTSGNLLFSGDDHGNIIALNAKTGECLWKFNLDRSIYSSPITYLVDGRQYISLVAGLDIFTFSLNQ